MEDGNSNKNPPKEESLMEEDGGNNIKPSSLVNNTKQEEEEEEEEEEEFSKEFQCCICLELLYKPVVLACGHLSCFWCVYIAMNYTHESHCPICRHPYNHFPNVCQLLHFLLQKMYPIAYKRRERQVGEEEKGEGCFSPQIDVHMFQSHPNQESDFPSNSLHSPRFPLTKLCAESCFSRKTNSSLLGDSSESTVHSDDDVKMIPSTSSRCSQGTSSTAIFKEYSLIGKELEHETEKQVSATDLLCPECQKLLIRPVVLNCGHVYCESCIIVREQGVPRCQICQSFHPNGFPRVCYVLEHFLQEQFPQIYAERLESLPKKSNVSEQAQQQAMQSPLGLQQVYSSWLFGNGPAVHPYVGCDSCGMCPIIGERYKCKDCVEKIGFDLCEACYKNPSKILGRFNQQHKPEHDFEITPPLNLHNQSVVLEQSVEDDRDAPEDNLYVFVGPNLTSVGPENIDNGSNNMEDVHPSFVMSIDTVDIASDGEDEATTHLSDLTREHI